MQYQKDPYSQKQNFLYRQAMYGLSAYNSKQVKTMNPEKKKFVIANQIKTQKILNTYKQKKTNEITNSIFKVLFPNSSFANDIIKHSRIDRNFINRLSFKELGISKQDIIDKLIIFNILPEDFVKL